MMNLQPHLIVPQAQLARLSRVCFEVVPASELVALVGATQRALAPVVQPVALDLRIAARAPDSPFPDFDVPMPKPGWFLCQDPAPQGVDYGAPVGRSPDVRRTPVLDEPTVTGWVREALDQVASGHVATLETLRMTHTRARLLSAELAGAATMPIFDGPDRFEVPTEQRNDGTWVSGEVEPDLRQPPIGVRLEYDGRLFKLYLTVAWSPWATEGTAEHAAFCACLRRLLDLSWEADGIAPAFECGMR